jgi:hypothetical protein
VIAIVGHQVVGQFLGEAYVATAVITKVNDKLIYVLLREFAEDAFKLVVDLCCVAEERI